MALYRCTGGGGFKETILWTNSSPSSSFSEQTVTLSQSVENFDYIAFDYYINTSNLTKRRIMVPIATLEGAEQTVKNVSGISLNAAGTSNTVQYARRIYYKTVTSLLLGTASSINSQGSLNTAAIPYQIIGIS